MSLQSRSPWDGHQVWAGPAATPELVEQACADMAQAGQVWAYEAGAQRIAALRYFAQVLAQYEDDFVDLLQREAGKTLDDARAEARLLPKKVSVTIDVALARTPQQMNEHQPGQPHTIWRPRGVAAVLGPFNFPLHLLNGLVVPALAVGCTVVAKPSEYTPACGELYERCLTEAGLDRAVRIVQGGPAIGAALVGNAQITTVAAVGGQAMGHALARQLADRPEVVLALELGGVNQALVLDDADQSAAVDAVAEGAWRMAGQRCTATRIVHVPRVQQNEWLTALERARGTWQADGKRGPMISSQAAERFLAPLTKLPAALRLVAGAAQADGCFVEPLLFTVDAPDARDASVYRHEWFGPALIVDGYDSIDEVLSRMAANPHRLAASVFTADHTSFLDCAARLPYGQVNHNRPTAGARSDQAFGGCGLAGNGHPAAAAACAIFADETVVW